jgi:hypothetical protein
MTTTHIPFVSESAYYIKPVCQGRTELLDRLAVALERLGQAKLQLEIGNSIGEVAKLRGECGAIRRELEDHRASHGC